MHTCPDCGQACCCNGDIEDIEIDDAADDCEHCIGVDDDDDDCEDPE